MSARTLTLAHALTAAVVAPAKVSTLPVRVEVGKAA